MTRPPVLANDARSRLGGDDNQASSRDCAQERNSEEKINWLFIPRYMKKRILSLANNSPSPNCRYNKLEVKTEREPEGEV
jgi:hypothetical protein